MILSTMGTLVQNTISFNEPNAETRVALEEAKNGSLRNTPSVDTSSIEALFKSADL